MMGFKVKAGALQLTMFMVVVIALLLAAFIILVHTHKRFKIQTNFVKETIVNADKGIDYVLYNKIPQNDTLQINLQDEAYKLVKVHKDYWGIFEKVMSTATIKHNSYSKIALVGVSQPQQNRTALYVEDNNKPLVVVGDTKIQGTVHLPKQGIRTGNIAGHSYYGKSLVYGSSRTSKAELPKLLKETRDRIKTPQNITKHISQEQFLDLGKQSVYINSFYNPLEVIYSPTDINLYDISLTGHILVQSETRIVVDATSNLKDVILIAPEIQIKDHTKGRFQAFATKNISIEKNCELDYPTVLVLNERPNSNKGTNGTIETPLIKINKHAKIKGAVAYLGVTKNYRAQVFIDENAIVTGEVYCNKNLELLGLVYGTVYTSNFVANQSGSSYQNHIYNGSILVDYLPQEYVGLAFEDSKKEVAKWLY